MHYQGSGPTVYITEHCGDHYSYFRFYVSTGHTGGESVVRTRGEALGRIFHNLQAKYPGGYTWEIEALSSNF